MGQACLKCNNGYTSYSKLPGLMSMIWMWDAVYGGLEGPSTDKTTRKPTKNEFLLVKREKNMKIHTSDMTK